jgi:folylpolyglutamate synthase
MYAPLIIASGYWRSPSQTRYMVENVRFQDTDVLSTPILGVIPGIPGEKQSSNVSLAVKTLDILRKLYPQITEEAVQKGIASAFLPGRMEWLRFELAEGKIPMLLDGAHNVASCTALGNFVASLRHDQPVVWLLAFSTGRDIPGCLEKLVRLGDSVGCVEFGRVDGMEWVKTVDTEMLLEEVLKVAGLTKGRVKGFGTDLKRAIRWGVQTTKERGGILVGAGSLYLVGEIHRLRRDDVDFGHRDLELAF